MSELRLGIVGVDSSHSEALAGLFHDRANPHYVPGARIVAAFPGGSKDFALSASRIEGFTRSMRDKHGVAILGSARELADAVDAVLHLSVDSRLHLAEFREIAPAEKPVFIDKPIAATESDARAIAGLATRHRVRLFSSSSLRFAGALRTALDDRAGGDIVGADFHGPMPLEAALPGFLWYGIHTVEMLYAALGPGCRRVRVAATQDHDVVTGVWADGRIGVMRGNRSGNGTFGGTLHRQKGSQAIDVATGTPFYAGLAAALVAFFRGGPAPVPLEETIELIQFLEAANESRESGREVSL